MTQNENKSTEGEKYKPQNWAVDRDPAPRGSVARWEVMETDPAGGRSAEAHAGQAVAHSQVSGPQAPLRHPVTPKPVEAGDLPALCSWGQLGSGSRIPGLLSNVGGDLVPHTIQLMSPSPW